MQVYLQNILVKYAHQGHQVKFKVTGANSLFLCPVRAITFECIYLQNSFSPAKYIFRISGSISSVKIVRSMSSSYELTKYTHVDGLPKAELFALHLAYLSVDFRRQSG